MFDLVVRGGTVVDGSGRPRFRADVGVQEGRIASIGRIREKAAEEIDAEGRFVAPGFIEVHTHMDAQVFWDPLGTCSSWHGITTAVLGNCGFTLAPCAEADKDLVMRSLERAEDISRDAMLAGITWQWETFPEYLDAVERTPKGINYAGYMGHSALRTYVMGERAFEQAGTDDDVAAMCRHLEEAVRAGALGLSTSRTPNHQTSDNKPVPSRQAEWSEVRALVNRMGGLGAGIFEIANEQNGTRSQARELRAAARPGRRVRATALVHSRVVPIVSGDDAGVHRSLRGDGGSRRSHLRSGPQP
jgi:N-acyl-D-aspartate/D-glutamate deacylase